AARGATLARLRHLVQACADRERLPSQGEAAKAAWPDASAGDPAGRGGALWCGAGGRNRAAYRRGLWPLVACPAETHSRPVAADDRFGPLRRRGGVSATTDRVSRFCPFRFTLIAQMISGSAHASCFRCHR